MAENQQLGPDQCNCNHCGAVISKKALVCPQCGVQWPVGKTNKAARTANGIMALVILVAVIVAIIVVLVRVL
jgi:uncharacterized paraquat-inducible protein A